MLYMCFHIGEVRYALQAGSIESVIPCVNLHASTELNSLQSGSLLYQQQLIPVYDLCQILLQRPSESALSTRILLIRNDTNNGSLCGIIAEQATGTARLDEVQPHIRTETLARMVHTDSHGTLQLINLPHLMGILQCTTVQNSGLQADTHKNFQTGSA